MNLCPLTALFVFALLLSFTLFSPDCACPSSVSYKCFEKCLESEMSSHTGRLLIQIIIINVIHRYILVSELAVCVFLCHGCFGSIADLKQGVYGESMHKVLHVGPDTCSVVSGLLRERRYRSLGCGTIRLGGC